MYKQMYEYYNFPWYPFNIKQKTKKKKKNYKCRLLIINRKKYGRI